MEKVSIIIPIYNVRDYVNGCLNSVFKQTYNNIEVILVNDCTPDDSMAVAKGAIEELRTRFEVIFINHKENQGLAEARNSGMKVATGEYIFFIDSDDEIIPECVELLHNEFTKYPEITFSTGGMIKTYLDREPETITYLEYISSNEKLFERFVRSLYFEVPVQAWNRLMKRAFLIENDIWFGKGLIYEDNLFTARLIMASSACSSVKKGTYIYAYRESSITAVPKKKKNICDMLYIYKSTYELANKYPKYLKDLFFLKSTMHCVASLLREPNEVADKDSYNIFKDIQDSYRSIKHSFAELIMVKSGDINIREKIILSILKYFPTRLSYSAIKILMRIGRNIKL